MARTKPITVKELYYKLEKILLQHWDKYVYTADDVEWNGYHWVYFGIETDSDDIKALDDNQTIDEDYKNVVIIW